MSLVQFARMNITLLLLIVHPLRRTVHDKKTPILPSGVLVHPTKSRQYEVGTLPFAPELRVRDVPFFPM